MRIHDDSPGGRTAHPATSPAGDALTMHAVTRRHGRGNSAVHALRGVNVRLPYGSFTAVMGPSGSGKSTLLQCGAGLDRATSGQVVLGGQDLAGMGERRLTRLRRSRVGFVFQSFNLLPALTAEQNVLLPLRLAGSRPDRAAAARALGLVGLADRARHRPGELSGGQQQRVAIARALITRPDLICADEPTGALDPATAEDVMGLLRQAVAEWGATVLMVTHDPAAAAWADRVLFLQDGTVVDEAQGSDAADIAARMRAMRTTRAPHAMSSTHAAGPPAGHTTATTAEAATAGGTVEVSAA
ncbi:ABC transporter ATP-binding protein [Streptomyces sp. NPDC050418]|uniref:ABC transporter ATP-binding protein n=1 Tax=Streptomyces sp. NPDC050418 TaxID=3365612 RepID=UPI0037B8937C